MSVAFFLRKKNKFRWKGVLIMQKKNLSRIALSGLLALSMVPAASMQIYADNKTAKESTLGEVRTSNRKANVTFTVDSEKGSFTEYGEGPVTFKNLDENSDEQYSIPAVTAKEGYKFVGWQGSGASQITWGADAKTFGVTGLCFYNEDATDGYASIEAVFEKVETPVVKKTAHVTFTVDSEKGSFTEYGTNPVKFDSDEDNDQQFVIPEVTAKEGYKFVGWKGQGADEITWGADAKTFGVTGLCFYNEDATDGYASIEAVFEKEETPETKRTSNVYFTVNPEYGSFTEYGEGPVTFLNLDENSDEQYSIPEVTAKEGYKFVGWKGQGADEISWGSDAKTFGVTGLCAFAEGATEGYASLEAQFEKVETPVVKKTAHVTFTVDSEKGSFTEYGTNPVKFDSDEDNDQQFVIPEVTAKEGYKFVGWKGQGADEITWGADAKTFGVTGLCFYNEDATDGYASIEAVFEKEETPETKRTSNVYFTVNPEYGSFTEYGEGPVTFLNLDENSDEQYLIPAVTAKEGYKFVGWKGQGADAIEWDADAKTFGVTGLCHFAEGETEGYASLEAVFEKVDTPAKEDNKKDDSKKDDSKKDDSKKDDSKKEDSKKADSKKADSKKADSKKEDNKVSTGAATGLFGSLAGVTAAGASLVALLRKKNSK